MVTVITKICWTTAGLQKTEELWEKMGKTESMGGHLGRVLNCFLGTVLMLPRDFGGQTWVCKTKGELAPKVKLPLIFPLAHLSTWRLAILQSCHLLPLGSLESRLLTSVSLAAWHLGNLLFWSLDSFVSYKVCYLAVWPSGKFGTWQSQNLTVS